MKQGCVVTVGIMLHTYRPWCLTSCSCICVTALINGLITRMQQCIEHPSCHVLLLPQVLYKVKWAGTDERTWEPFSNLGIAGAGGEALFRDWLLKHHQQTSAESALAVCIAEETNSEVLDTVTYSGPMPTVPGTGTSISRPAIQSTQQQQQQQQHMHENDNSSSHPSSNNSKLCTKYAEGRFDGKSCGVFQSFDACGFPNAPMEMIGGCQS